MENKRKIGAQKELLAADYLQKQGVKIICRNYYFHGGEIDLVVKDREYLVFVEVKFRKNHSYGFPAEAVTKAKQKTLLRGARQYLYQNHLPSDTPCRFDVISMEGEDIVWIVDAFSAD